MYDPARRARERRIEIEVKKLELRQALERARRRPAGPGRDAAARGAAEDVRSEDSGGGR